MNNLAIWYGTMVRVCREDEVMSQQELAWASRMSLDAIKRLEDGRGGCEFDEAVRLGLILDIELNDSLNPSAYGGSQ